MSAESRQRHTAKRQQDKTRLTELRRRAEHRVFPLTRPSTTLVQEDVEGLLYELQVHQIELEMQCRQLQESQCETEESRNNYRELYESIPIGYATIEASGKVCDLNPAGASLLRLPAGHRLSTFHVFVATEDLDRFDLLCRDVLGTGQGRTADLSLERAKGGPLAAEVGIYPVRVASGPPKLRLTFQDVSMRRTVEATVQLQQEQLERNRRDLQLLTARLHCAREDERRRIADTLRHDHCRRLSACIADLQSAAQRLEVREREELEHIAMKLRQVFHDVTRVGRNPDTNGANLPLARSMRRYVDYVSATASLPIEFRELHVGRDIPRPIAKCIYRVMKEGLENIVKHAGCTQAVVTLTGSAGGIELRVLDDGRGFDLTDVFRAKKGKGLMGIQHQVCLLEGKVAIQSRPGHGAELKIFIPMPMCHQDVSVVAAA
jgi:signal transduction histidine kinase